ncbi:MAG TPA: DUF2017 domain-containing protein [Streptosporangiaceae bacterium]
MSDSEGPADVGYPGSGFRGARGGGATARFAPEGAMLLRTLVSQVAELVGEYAAGDEDTEGRDPLGGMLRLSDNSRLPDDPVLARLLPDAYRDDPEAAGEFRRYTEGSLRASKAAAAQAVLDTLPEHGGRVRLSADDAQAWLRAINDVRLALGVRLEVTEDWEAMLDRLQEDDPRAAGLWIYDWLTVLQDTLVQVLW